MQELVYCWSKNSQIIIIPINFKFMIINSIVDQRIVQIIIVPIYFKFIIINSIVDQSTF